jgi:hypothetical protein
MAEEKRSVFKTWHKVLFVLLGLCFMGLKVWQAQWPTANVELKGLVLHVQVAETLYQMHKGLGERDTLAPYDGMLFPFDFPQKPGIVMRDMRFPIDIVWIMNGHVVDIAPHVMPEPGVSERQLTIYYPRVQANFVLELPAGWVEEHGLEIGDTIRLIEE